MWPSSQRLTRLPPYRMGSKTNFSSQHTYRGAIFPDSCYKVLPARTQIGHNINQGDQPSKFAWFSTELTGDAVQMLEIGKIDDGDTLRDCLDPYQGVTRTYFLKTDTKLLDMSKIDTIDNIGKLLDDAGKKLLAVCFPIHPIHRNEVIRYSDPDKDKQLFQLLTDENIIDKEIPGWYHPTMNAQSYEDVNTVDKIHRREIVLLEPSEHILPVVTDDNGSPSVVRRLHAGERDGPNPKRKGKKFDSSSKAQTLRF